MELKKENVIYIKSAFAKMKSKNDFLSLLNYTKIIIYGPQAIPFKIKHINFHSNPSENPRRYYTFSIKKKSGSERIINSPNRGLKALQKCLNLIFQTIYEPNIAAKGFVPKRSIVDNAKVHIGSTYVYNIDLKDFFSSIDQARVWGRLKHPPFNLNDRFGKLELANIIASLCCHRMEVERLDENGQWIKVYKNVLPQGAPTSPTLTNVICQRLDFYLSAVAKRFGLKYSRYADDITFSSMHNVYQENGEFILELKRIIKLENFNIKESKTRLQKQDYRQIVTGLVVNNKANVSIKYIKELRKDLYYWEHYGFEKANSFFMSKYFSDSKHSSKEEVNMTYVIAGKLDFLRMVKGEENEMYKKMRDRFAVLYSEIANVSKIKTPKKVQITIRAVGRIPNAFKIGKRLIIEKGEIIPYQHTFDNEEEEEDTQFDLSKHKPIDVSNFLRNFSRNANVKFLTHDFDLPNSVFNRSEYLKLAKSEFTKLSKTYSIPPSLWSRISWFIGDGPKVFHFRGEQHTFNWNSEELIQWLKDNPGLHPSKESSLLLNKMIIPFRKSIEIKAPELKEIINNKLANGIYNSFDITSNDLIDIDKANFYTDVDALERGLGYLFNAIKQRLSNSDKLRIEFTTLSDEYGRKKIIRIIHLNSISNKSLNKSELLKGDLLEAEKAFFGICDWSIISKSPDASVNKINILFDASLATISPTEKIDDTLIEGFTHILTFY